MHKRIGIICASDTELEPFLELMKDKRVTEKVMLRFYEGTIGRIPVTAVYSGVCKVNAAIAAQLMIEGFCAEGIINAGTAGGMHEGVRLFDTVVSEQVAYHDVAEDILTEFHPWLKSCWFQADPELMAAARAYSQIAEYPVLFGKMVSGEQFIEDRKREAINRKFSPLSVDMETTAIAHVCHVNKTPFIAIRTITDTAEHKGIVNFEKNCETASKIASRVVQGVLNQLSRQESDELDKI